jgi:hypothetical protein
LKREDAEDFSQAPWRQEKLAKVIIDLVISVTEDWAKQRRGTDD